LVKMWKEMVVIFSHLVYRFYPQLIPFLSTNFLVSFSLSFLPDYRFLILYLFIIIFVLYSIFLSLFVLLYLLILILCRISHNFFQFLREVQNCSSTACIHFFKIGVIILEIFIKLSVKIVMTFVDLFQLS
jgi:hypothetical protein